MNTKTIVMAIAGYLIVVGGAMYVSESSTASPTADSLAAFPSLGSGMLNVGAGLALLLFAPRLAKAV